MGNRSWYSTGGKRLKQLFGSVVGLLVVLIVRQYRREGFPLLWSMRNSRRLSHQQK